MLAAAGITYNPEPGRFLRRATNTDATNAFICKPTAIFTTGSASRPCRQWPLVKPVRRCPLQLRIEYKKNRWKCSSVQNTKATAAAGRKLVDQRYVTGEAIQNAVFFNLQLKDLSNIGNNPFEKLRLAIPGCSKTNEVVKQ